GLGRHLRGERGRLARSLEADLAGRRPGDDVADRVGDGHDGVVERAPDVGVPVGDVLAFLAAYLLGGAGAALGRHLLPLLAWRASVRGWVSAPGAANYFFPAFFLPATVFFRPLRVRALVCVRWPCTGSPRRWRMPW